MIDTYGEFWRGQMLSLNKVESMTIEKINVT